MIDDINNTLVENELPKKSRYIMKFDYEKYIKDKCFLMPENKKKIKFWKRNKELQKAWYAKLRIAEGENSSMENLLYYDRPVVEKELNGNKVLLYEAWGIPKDLITYSTEFINKTTQTYLNIVGKYENEAIGFENDINIHLEIDTHIYDGYEVHIENGVIEIILHEIKNEIPVLKDYGVA